MKAEEMDFFRWQEHFSREVTCVGFLAGKQWANAFACPKCGHDGCHWLSGRPLYRCSHCYHQVSVTAGTQFPAGRLALRKWFWAIYRVGKDKGGIFALRLSRLLGVSWPTAYRMLHKLRIAMGHRGALYRLEGWIAMDKAFIGSKRSGKRGREAEGKVPVLVACENRDQWAGYLAMEVTESLSSDQVRQFAERRLKAGQTVFTDALSALKSLEEGQRHCPRVTPLKQASRWLPWVHIAIARSKRYLLGTYYGVKAGRLQEYLDKFCYRFNRRFWESQLPMWLLTLCISHASLKLGWV